MTRPEVDTAHAPPIDADPLTIAEVSELLNITSHTARYYERAGLIDVPRSCSGHRFYDRNAVARLDFLVRMRTSGMGIAELRRYVDLVRAGDSTTDQRLQIMLDQRKRITAQLRELELALAATDYKIATYGGAPDLHRAPTPGHTPPPTSVNNHRPEGEPS